MQKSWFLVSESNTRLSLIKTIFQSGTKHLLSSCTWWIHLCSKTQPVCTWGCFTVRLLTNVQHLPVSHACVPSSLCDQITSTCHSSSSASPLPILQLFYHPFIPSVSLFIQSDRVGPAYHCLSVWVNTHTPMNPHTQTWLPPIYLTQCLYSLAPNWPLAGQMDRWPMVGPSFFPSSDMHSLRHTHRGMPTLLWD